MVPGREIGLELVPRIKILSWLSTRSLRMRLSSSAREEMFFDQTKVPFDIFVRNALRLVEDTNLEAGTRDLKVISSKRISSAW